LLDKTGSLPASFPVQIIYRIVSYRTACSLTCRKRAEKTDLAGNLRSISDCCVSPQPVCARNNFPRPRSRDSYTCRRRLIHLDTTLRKKSAPTG